MRDGLRTLLTAEAEIDVVAETDDGGTTVALARRLHPDLVVINLRLPRVDGLTATRVIRAELPDTQVVVLAGADDEALALASVRAGACAHLSKATPVDVVVRTIRAASAGQVTLPSNAVARLVRAHQGRASLSNRESEVLPLVAPGQANK